MDLYTRRHLSAWCDRTTLTDDASNTLFLGIMAFLADADDAVYWFGMGWPTVRDAAAAAGYRVSLSTVEG